MRTIARARVGMIVAATLILAGCGGGGNNESYKDGFDVGKGESYYAIEQVASSPDQACSQYEETMAMGPKKIDKAEFVRGCLDGWKQSPNYSSGPKKTNDFLVP